MLKLQWCVFSVCYYICCGIRFQTSSLSLNLLFDSKYKKGSTGLATKHSHFSLSQTGNCLVSIWFCHSQLSWVETFPNVCALTNWQLFGAYLVLPLPIELSRDLSQWDADTELTETYILLTIPGLIPIWVLHTLNISSVAARACPSGQPLLCVKWSTVRISSCYYK
jgi:hypothetical protein